MPRMEVQLRALNNFEYETDRVNRTLKGRLGSALRGTEFAERHDKPITPGYTFLPPYNGQDVVEQGDEARVTIASHWGKLLAIFRDDLRDDPVLEVGNGMRYKVIEGHDKTNSSKIEVGDAGVLETQEGALIEVPTNDSTEAYWKTEHGINTLRRRINQNIRHKARAFGIEADPRTKPIDNIRVTKTYAHPYQVTKKQQIFGVFTHLRAEVEAPTELHRDYVQLLLDTGLGKKCSYGFGFLYYYEGDVVEADKIEPEAYENEEKAKEAGAYG